LQNIYGVIIEEKTYFFIWHSITTVITIYATLK
jgi:hypothetical protein